MQESHHIANIFDRLCLTWWFRNIGLKIQIKMWVHHLGEEYETWQLFNQKIHHVNTQNYS
jgi:hypothetical protein